MIIRNIEKKNNDEFLVRFESGNVAFWGKDFLENKMRVEEDINNFTEMLNALNS